MSTTNYGKVLESLFFTLVTHYDLEPEEQGKLQEWFNEHQRMSSWGIPLAFLYDVFAAIAQISSKLIQPDDFEKVRKLWIKDVRPLEIYVWLGADQQRHIKVLDLRTTLAPYANTTREEN